jgi:hypothetical protein
VIKELPMVERLMKSSDGCNVECTHKDVAYDVEACSDRLMEQYDRVVRSCVGAIPRRECST